MSSDIQIPIKFNDSDFREVQIQDQSENPRSPFILIPAGSRPGGFQPIPLSQLNSVPPLVSPLDPKDIKYKNVLKSSKKVRYISILDMVYCLSYIIIGEFILVFLVIFGLLGFFSSYKLHRSLSMSYIITLMFVMILKLLIAADENELGFAGLMILYFILEGISLYFSIKFFKILGTLEPKERLELLALQNGPNRSNRGLARSETARPIQIPAGPPANESVQDNSSQLGADFEAPGLKNLQPIQEFPSIVHYSEGEGTEQHDRPLNPSDRLE
ncbi:unnamed protein product [Blepharisma stoltei]|uniref:Uncharacterized protein n=1 Tax=Blepharisma stoltei TaxID=1481888 RepID=A0AAU9KFA7_9CILI|nr:unnamed protein product [Blepharisma stoltei]